MEKYTGELPTINQLLANQTMNDMIILDSERFRKPRTKIPHVDPDQTTFITRNPRIRFVNDDYQNIIDNHHGYWLFSVYKTRIYEGIHEEDPHDIVIYVQPLCFISNQKDANYMESLLFLRKNGRLLNLKKFGCEPKISNNQFESTIMDLDIILDPNISRSVEFHSLCIAYDYFRFFNCYPLELDLMNTTRIEDSVVYPRHFGSPYDFMCATLYSKKLNYSIPDILALLRVGSWLVDDILSIYNTGIHHSICLEDNSATINAYNPNSLHSMNLFTRKYPYVKKFIDKYIDCYLSHPYRCTTANCNESSDSNLDWLLSSLAFYFDAKYSAVDKNGTYTILDKAEYLLPILPISKEMTLNDIEDLIYPFNPFIKYFSN